MASGIPTSGTLRGNALHLSGGANGASLILDLVRSNEGRFRTQVADLDVQAGKIAQARIQQEIKQRLAQREAQKLADLGRFIQMMQAFADLAQAAMPKLAPVERNYRDTTQRMRAAFARERSIVGDGQASVARSQIAVNINQAAIDANQIHIEQDQFRQTLNSQATEILRRIPGGKNDCQIALFGSGGLADHDAWAVHSAADTCI
jgi:hypothetical protein